MNKILPVKNQTNKNFDCLQDSIPLLINTTVKNLTANTLITNKTKEISLGYGGNGITGANGKNTAFNNNLSETRTASKDLIYEYIKTLKPSNILLKSRGVFIKYNKIISYFYNNNNNISSQNNLIKTPRSQELIKNTNKLLIYFFKSMYCIISKPVYYITPDKITIKLFYYINIPTKKVFKWFVIFYKKKIRDLWLKFRSAQKKISQKKILKNFYLRWKLKNAIFKLKNKNLKIRKILFNLFRENLSKVYYYKFKTLCEILSKKYNKAIELQLIRLHHPYQDSNILVNFLALNIKNKFKKPRVAILKIFNKNKIKNLNDLNLFKFKINNIPAFTSGLNISIAGRLMREPIIPRITTKNFDKGAKATGKVNFLDSAFITKKNKKGAYTIKITSGQNFFI